MKQKTSLGYLTGLGATFLLATTAIFISYLASAGLKPLVLAFWRAAFLSLPVLAGVMIHRNFLKERRPLGRAAVLTVLVQGLILGIFNISWTFSVVANGAAQATVLVYSSAFFTLCIEAVLGRQRLTRMRIAAALCILGGCVIFCRPEGGFLIQSGGGFSGLILGLGAGAAYALYSLAGRRAAEAGCPVLLNMGWSFAVSGLVILACFLVTSGGFPELVPRITTVDWGVLVIFALVPTLGGYGLYNLTLKRLSAGTANLLVASEPLFTIVIAWLVLGDRFPAFTLPGAAAVVLGVGLLAKGEK